MNWEDEPDEPKAETTHALNQKRSQLTVFMAAVLVLAAVIAVGIGVSGYASLSGLVGKLDAAAEAKVATLEQLHQIPAAHVALNTSYGFIFLGLLSLMAASLVWRSGPRVADTIKLYQRFGEPWGFVIRLVQAKLFLLGVALAGAFCMGFSDGVMRRLDDPKAMEANLDTRLQVADAAVQGRISHDQVEAFLNRIENQPGDPRLRALADLAAEVKSDRFRNAPHGMRDTMSQRIWIVLKRTQFDDSDAGAVQQVVAVLDPPTPAARAEALRNHVVVEPGMPAPAIAATIHPQKHARAVRTAAAAKPARIVPDAKGIARYRDAVGHQDLKALARMLDEGWDPNFCEPGGFTALSLAVGSNNAEMTRLLLDHGANVDLASGPQHQRPIYAAAAARAEMLPILFEHHASLQARDETGWTPLHYAANTQNLPAIAFLLEHGANVNALDRDRRTPLDYARKSRMSPIDRHEEVCDLLTGHGGKVAAELGGTAQIDPAK
jgi:hypothetical protein